MNTICQKVGEIEKSIRLDVFIASINGAPSRSQLKTCNAKVSVNGKPTKLSKSVKTGDLVEVAWQDCVPTEIEPVNLPLEIIYEDENVTIINKKQGMVVHPACGNWDNTLVNALLYHWKRGAICNAQNEQNATRPGIVHRLDKDTSGVIITSCTQKNALFLQQQFMSRRVAKEYIAIVVGRPKTRRACIKTGICRDSKNRKRFTTCKIDKGKFAHTNITCLAMYGNFSLLKIKIKTGRTHQIRVHLKHIGCAILGDPLYNKKVSPFESATLMLHARTLGIRTSAQSDFAYFTAPLPRRFKKVLKTLHTLYQKEKFLQDSFANYEFEE